MNKILIAKLQADRGKGKTKEMGVREQDRQTY